jgi:hypothetical protein
MAIDDPKAAFEQQYLPRDGQSPLGLVVFTGKLAFPKAALPLEMFRTVVDRFTRASVDERLQATWNMLVMETEHLETTKANTEDVQEAIQLAMRRDAEEFNDKKRERYVKLIGNALRSDKEVRDVATFVRTVEQLNERDAAVLRVLNKIMNQEGDWRPQANPGIGPVMKLHPSTLLSRAQELAVQIAMALGQRIETNQFSREEGFMICLRLQGFGLAREIQPDVRELPLTNYAFQLTVQGIRLLKLLGEHVPNCDHYSES